MKTSRCTVVTLLRRRRPIIVLCCALLIVVYGCGKEQGSKQTQQAVSVRIQKARAGTLRETVQGIGSLKAVKTVEIKPEIAGIIVEVGFQEGEAVQRGTILYRIDDSTLRQELKAAKAAKEAAKSQVTNAEWRFERMEELRREDVAAPEEYKELRDRLKQSQAERERAAAEVELITERLEDTRLTAPMAGAIGQSRVDVGDFVDVGQRLATLYSRSPLESEVTLPERTLGRVEEGQSVTIRTDAYPDRAFSGRVIFVSPSVRAATRDLAVKAEIPNEAGLLKPGQFVAMNVTLERREDAVIIPEESLVQTRKGYVAYVVEEDEARRRNVRIGLRQAGIVEIREGIEVGDKVVTQGQMRLRDGARVKTIEATVEPKPSTTRTSSTTRATER